MAKGKSESKLEQLFKEHPNARIVPVFVPPPGSPAGWTAQDESIRLGNMCTSYRAVIQDLGSRIARHEEGRRRREAIKVLKEALAEAERRKEEFDQRWKGQR